MAIQTGGIDPAPGVTPRAARRKAEARAARTQPGPAAQGFLNRMRGQLRPQGGLGMAPSQGLGWQQGMGNSPQQLGTPLQQAPPTGMTQMPGPGGWIGSTIAPGLQPRLQALGQQPQRPQQAQAAFEGFGGGALGGFRDWGGGGRQVF